MMTLGELTRTIEQDVKNRSAWPSGPSRAGIAYTYAYGKMAGELESKWQWDVPRERTRFYRQSLHASLVYLVRMYILTRIVGPLRHVGQDITVNPPQYGGSDLLNSMVHLSELSAMLNNPTMFFKAINVICMQTKIKYGNVLYEATIAPVARKPIGNYAEPARGQ